MGHIPRDIFRVPPAAQPAKGLDFRGFSKRTTGLEPATLRLGKPLRASRRLTRGDDGGSWNIDLRELPTKSFELDDERLVAMVDDGAVMFELVGKDLHLVGPLGETGRVACHVVEPDGHYYLAATADDPYSSKQAGLN